MAHSTAAAVHPIEPAPLPYTDWDRLVAAREDVVIAAMAEHRALNSVRTVHRTYTDRCLNLNTLRASLYVLSQSRTALRRCQGIEQDAFLMWTSAIDNDIAAEHSADPDARSIEADALLASRDIEDRTARGEKFA